MAESKFTLGFDALNATPSGAPYVLNPGQVGVLYPTVDNGGGIFTMFGDPNPFNCTHHPFGYLLQAGTLPPGLNFNFSSPLAIPPNCPIGFPPTLGPGINAFDATGFPSLAGVYNFTIRFHTSRYEPPDEPGGSFVDKDYQIEIAESTLILRETDDQPFTCTFDPPPAAADLIYFDNTNTVPVTQIAPFQSPPSPLPPFNDELSDVWLGWDRVSNRLCITNYNRTITICCYEPQVVLPTLIKNIRYIDNSNVVPNLASYKVVPTPPFNDEPSNVWIGFDMVNLRLCIMNYNRTIIICCYDPDPAP